MPKSEDMIPSAPTRGPRWGLAAAGVLCLVSAAAQADESAHQHGVGRVNVAAFEGELLVELSLPGVHTVGFEHEARTAEERERLATVRERFRAPDGLIMPSGAAQCGLRSEAIRLAEHHADEHEAREHGRAPRHGAGHEGEGHARGEERHDGERGHGRHDNAAHEDPALGDGRPDLSKDAAPEGHLTLEARYVYHCGAFDKLTEINFPLFDVLLGSPSLRARVVTPGGQTLRTLSEQSRTLRLLP